MKRITLLTIPLLSMICSSQVSINEIDADQTGTDTQEFIELLSETPKFSLDGFIVVLYNGSDDLSYKTVDLNGFTTDANGFFIIGDTDVPDVDISLGASNKIQNGPDAIAIYEDLASNFPNNTPVTSTNLIDAIVYDTDDDDDPELLAGLGETIQYDEDANGNKDTESLQNDGQNGYCANLPTLRLTNSCALGVQNILSDTFQVYPNPAANGFVNISSKMNGVILVSLYNILGKKVIATELNGNRLDISSLVSGIYILKIVLGKNSTTIKLVVK